MERLLSIDPSNISNTSDNKTEHKNDQDAYICKEAYPEVASHT